MMKMILAAALALLGAPPALAAQSGCQDTTGQLVLEKVRSNAVGTQIYGCINRSFDLLSSSVAIHGSTSTQYGLGTIYVNKIGGRAAGTPNIQISSSVWSHDSSLYMLWAGTATFQRLGVTYDVRAGSGAFTSGITASSGTFTGTGATQASVATSSGIVVAAGGVTAPYFSGVLDGGDIRAATIDTAKLKNGIIDTNKLAADAVTNIKIIDGAVDTRKLNALHDTVKTCTNCTLTVGVDGRATGVTSGSVSGGPFSSEFDSGEVTFTVSQTTYVAHGLGGLPKFCTWMLKNESTECGYDADDEVQVTNTDDGDGVYRSMNWMNATNVGTEIGSRPFLIEAKPSGDFCTATTTNWRLRFRCYK